MGQVFRPAGVDSGLSQQEVLTVVPVRFLPSDGTLPTDVSLSDTGDTKLMRLLYVGSQRVVGRYQQHTMRGSESGLLRRGPQNSQKYSTGPVQTAIAGPTQTTNGQIVLSIC